MASSRGECLSVPSVGLSVGRRSVGQVLRRKLALLPRNNRRTVVCVCDVLHKSSAAPSQRFVVVGQPFARLSSRIKRRPYTPPPPSLSPPQSPPPPINTERGRKAKRQETCSSIRNSQEEIEEGEKEVRAEEDRSLTMAPAQWHADAVE